MSKRSGKRTSRGTVAQLREFRSGRLCQLEAEHLVGRGAGSALVLDHPWVSSRHALLRWVGEAWEIRDLGSLNGTWLEGEPIAGPAAHKLRRGSTICFGHQEVTWELVDDAPPVAMAIPVAGGEPVLAQGDLLAWPSGDEPPASLFRDAGGLWRREPGGGALQADGGDVVADGQIIVVGGHLWRFCCAGTVTETVGATTAQRSQQTRLEFQVSRDEEHVAISACVAGQRLDLGARGHNYVLLTLARYRLKDHEAGLPETSCGWIDQDQLLRALAVTRQQLHIDVFRIRKQLADLGFHAPASIIERRPGARQLRLGCADVSITTV